MKKLLFLFCFLLLSFSVNSQQLAYGNEIEAIEICRQLTYTSFPEPIDKEVDKVLEKIISITGLEKNFQLQICSNIYNASALSYNGVRYIFYDKDFLEAISGENRWFVTFVLAHEVAHHLQDHTKDVFMYLNGFQDDMNAEQSRYQELEADKWAGFILGKLGCSFEDAIDAVSQLPNDEAEDLSSDHPHEALRINAVAEGYNNAVGGIQGLQFDKYQGDNTGMYLIHFYNGVEKYNNGDLDGALKDFNKSIIDKKEFPEPYINRAIIKKLQGDLYGAISDLELAMKWNPNTDLLYVERGAIRLKLGQYELALDDYNIAISKNENSLPAYFNRAVLKRNILNGSLPSDIYTDIWEIIMDFDKCIEIYPNYLEARYYRAQTIIQGLNTNSTSHLLNTAIDDIDISLAYVDDYKLTIDLPLRLFKANNYDTRAMLNLNLGNYSSVISDANRVIQMSKDFLEDEGYQQLFVKAYIYKIAIYKDNNSHYYDISALCNNIDEFFNIVQPKLDDFNFNNRNISQGINLIQEWYEMYCY